VPEFILCLSKFLGKKCIPVDEVDEEVIRVAKILHIFPWISRND
jgi:hypothetical protein